jgi:hypothetical protein
MTSQPFDEEKFTGEIRKFLKKVGITSQIEIETAVRNALAAGQLTTKHPLHARMLLEIPSLGLQHTVEHDLSLD